MGIDTTTAAMHPSTNALDALPDDLLDTPPAYFALGTTPSPMENPPEIGDVRTFTVRAVCSGIGESVRTDGERRHVRKFVIQAAWMKGDPEPPNADADQPALFGDDGEATDDPEALGDVLDNVSRPSFSNGSDE